MKRSDISDLDVVSAYSRRGDEFPDDLLMREKGAPFKVAYAAMERAAGRGYLEYGVSLRTGWLTAKGKALLESHGWKLMEPVNR